MHPPTPRRGALIALLALATLTLAAPTLSAQGTATISGRVREASSGRPLANITVFVTGTERRALTTETGRYRLLGVRPGSVTLQVRGLGFRSVSRALTLAAGDSQTVDIELSEAAIQLDEVVVTGTGAQTEKRKLGNTVASISTKALETAPVTNVSEVLQGREPGVMALPSGGLAGEGAKIRIRGGSSLSQSNEPIVYVDGVRVDNAGGFGPMVGQPGGSPSRLDDINPESIERIEVLKGSAAATLYGTEAANGVIQIFTKKGSAGPPRYSMHVEQGMSKYPNDAYAPHAGFARRQSQADSIAEFWGLGSLQPYQVFEIPLIPKIYETGHSQSYAVDVSGGSAQVNYYVAGRYQHENGPFGGKQWGPAKDLSEHKQANASLTVFPGDRFLVRLNSMYNETHNQTPDNNNNIYGTISILINSKPELANANNLSGAPAFTTVREAMQRLTTGDVRRFGGSLNANYRPFGTIALDGTMGIDVVDQMATRMLPFGWNVDNYANANVRGSRTASTRNFRQLSFEGKASWEETLGRDITSSLVVGGQLFSSEENASGGTGEEFPGPGVEVIGAGNIQTNFESYLAQVSAGVFAQEQVGWRNWAFLTVGGRYDKHSAFGESAGGAFYPKASLSLVPSELGWWNKNLFSTFRVRAAIGKSGLQPGAFDKYTTFVPQPSDAGAGVAPGNLGNPYLKPEVSTEVEGGFEIAVLNDRAALDVTYWRRTVQDALVQRQFPPSGGFNRPQLDNIGKNEGNGWEMGLKGQVISRPSWSLNLFANGSYLHQIVTDMGEAPEIKVSGNYARRVNYIKEGYAPGAFFAPKLMDVRYPLATSGNGITTGCTPASEADLLTYFATPRSPDALIVIVDKCGQADRNHYIGKPWPDWSGAFGGDLSFLRRFRVSTLFEFRAGDFKVHDLTGAFRRSHGLIGRNIRRAAEIESILLNPASTAAQRLEAARVWATELKALTPVDGLNEIHDADFIRWRELSLTYDAPNVLASRIGANTLSLTLSGRNLALFTKFPGADPEISAFGRGASGTLANNFNEGINEWGLPIARRFSLSVRASF